MRKQGIVFDKAWNMELREGTKDGIIIAAD